MGSAACAGVLMTIPPKRDGTEHLIVVCQKLLPTICWTDAHRQLPIGGLGRAQDTMIQVYELEITRALLVLGTVGILSENAVCCRPCLVNASFRTEVGFLVLPEFD